ncbi:ankyrin repeat-containing domain protein [Chytriomyces sp. MP71]|nr:ankyrin repeat-containing domain protein [Chytriomyces sp. MP71]
MKPFFVKKLHGMMHGSHVLTLATIPPEIRREILYRLPIHGPDLKAATLLTRGLFDVTVNGALTHVAQFLATLPAPTPDSREDLSSRIHLLLKRIVLKDWDLLPLVYKAAVYSHIFSASAGGYEDIEYHEWRWHISDSTALAIVHTLARSKFDLSVQRNRAFRWACDFEHIAAARCLLETGKVNPGDYDNYALRVASNYGHLSVVSFLLSLNDDRVDANADDNFAIGAACANGHTEIVSLLLQQRNVDPAAMNHYAMRFACQNGHTRVVDQLLNEGRADPTADGNYGVISACQNGHEGVVALLLADGRADVAADNQWPVKIAAQHGHLGVVKLLVADSRVDVTVDNELALSLAENEGHIEVADFLREVAAAR